MIPFTWHNGKEEQRKNRSMFTAVRGEKEHRQQKGVLGQWKYKDVPVVIAIWHQIFIKNYQTLDKKKGTWFI
jgi:hypothetical protein